MRMHQKQMGNENPHGCQELTWFDHMYIMSKTAEQLFNINAKRDDGHVSYVLIF